jgi:hypothetical protein
LKIHLGVIVVVLFAAVMSAHGQNLLQNPGFETWAGGMPSHWLRDDSIVIKQDNNRVHSGAYSARDSLVTQNQDRADFYQGAFAASPNTQYTFSAYVYDNDPAGRIRQVVSWHTASGWNQDYATTYSSNAASWQAMTMTVLSPAGTDSALVSFRAYDSSAAWDGDAVFNIDDASFTPAAVQPPVILRTWHKPTNPASGSPLQAFCVVCDDGTITNDTLYYGINGLSVLYRETHQAVSGDTFRYQIPGQPAGDTVRYFIEYRDDDGQIAVSDTHSCLSGIINVRINEVYYDAPGEDSGCFIELHGPAGISLDHMTIAGVNGTNGADYALIALDLHSIPPDGFFVLGQNQWVLNADTAAAAANLQNGPDNLELRCGSVTIDALGYGALDGWVFTGEWLPAHDVAEGHCLGRYPDGHDSDDNSHDFIDYDTITPGLPNAAAGLCEDGKMRGNYAPGRRSIILSGPFKFSSIMREDGFYPVCVYDCLGRLLATGKKPSDEIRLRPGVYFVILGGSGNDRFGIKLLVIS